MSSRTPTESLKKITANAPECTGDPASRVAFHKEATADLFIGRETQGLEINKNGLDASNDSENEMRHKYGLYTDNQSSGTLDKIGRKRALFAGSEHTKAGSRDGDSCGQERVPCFESPNSDNGDIQGFKERIRFFEQQKQEKKEQSKLPGRVEMIKQRLLKRALGEDDSNIFSGNSSSSTDEFEDSDESGTVGREVEDRNGGIAVERRQVGNQKVAMCEPAGIPCDESSPHPAGQPLDRLAAGISCAAPTVADSPMATDNPLDEMIKSLEATILTSHRREESKSFVFTDLPAEETPAKDCETPSLCYTRIEPAEPAKSPLPTTQEILDDFSRFSCRPAFLSFPSSQGIVAPEHGGRLEHPRDGRPNGENSGGADGVHRADSMRMEESGALAEPSTGEEDGRAEEGRAISDRSDPLASLIIKSRNLYTGKNPVFSSAAFSARQFLFRAPGAPLGTRPVLTPLNSILTEQRPVQYIKVSVPGGTSWTVLKALPRHWDFSCESDEALSSFILTDVVTEIFRRSSFLIYEHRLVEGKFLGTSLCLCRGAACLRALPCEKIEKISRNKLSVDGALLEFTCETERNEWLHSMQRCVN